MFANLKIFLGLGFLLILLLAGAAGIGLRDQGMQSVIEGARRDGERAAYNYGEQVWPAYRSVLMPILSDNPAGLRDNPQVSAFAQDTLRHFRALPLERVNIYSASGLLLLSLDLAQTAKIDGPVSPDAGFAKAGLTSHVAVTQLIPASRGAKPLTLAQTVAPVKAGAANELAIEMLYDVTAPMERQMDMQMIGAGAVAVLLAVFMLLTLLSSRRAENIIARQHEANMDLAAAAAAAQAENREKSQFLANISHELRTPLNAIIGFSDIIKNEVMPMIEIQKYKDYINDINSSGVHLLSLINDILDYSKAEAGKLEMEVSEVNASKLIQNSMRLVAPRAEAAQVRLTEALPKEQLTMITDSKKFKQILLNLLSNAVKFTPANGEVRITAWRDLAEDTISFEVRDSGIGIAPKDISRAMAPFGQVDSALSRKYEGTGLGLPLTKKFVELMGGKFAIESEVGKGTTVTFTLPRELTAREGVIIKQVA